MAGARLVDVMEVLEAMEEEKLARLLFLLSLALGERFVSIQGETDGRRNSETYQISHSRLLASTWASSLTNRSRNSSKTFVLVPNLRFCSFNTSILVCSCLKTVTSALSLMFVNSRWCRGTLLDDGARSSHVHALALGVGVQEELPGGGEMNELRLEL